MRRFPIARKFRIADDIAVRDLAGTDDCGQRLGRCFVDLDNCGPGVLEALIGIKSTIDLTLTTRSLLSEGVSRSARFHRPVDPARSQPSPPERSCPCHPQCRRSSLTDTSSPAKWSMLRFSF